MATSRVSTSGRTGVTSRPRGAIGATSKTLQMMSPTAKAIYREIVSYIASHGGLAPTQHEIASSIRIGEGGHIRWHLQKLEKAGLIVLLPRARRGIRLPEETPAAPEANAYEHFISQWGGA